MSKPASEQNRQSPVAPEQQYSPSLGITLLFGACLFGSFGLVLYLLVS